MEIKKSNNASLEDKRVTFFLLGLILSFSLIVVGWQYKSHPYDPDFDAESLEDLAQDLELSTPSEQKDMVSAEAPAAPEIGRAHV